MDKTKKKQASLHDILFRAAGIIALLTLLSFWLISGLLGRYTKEDKAGNNARTAAFGAVKVLEHKAVHKTVSEGEDVASIYYDSKYNDMVYYLDEVKEVDGNFYNVMMPGVDIPKDVFVRVGSAEVDCQLYLEITSKGIPQHTDPADGTKLADSVTFEIDEENWELVKIAEGSDGEIVYKYKCIYQISADTKTRDINILKDKKLKVSQYYDADSAYAAAQQAGRIDSDGNVLEADFSLTFQAYIEQVD